jgi:NAD(P)-dependent dehydrogenase (short-subunit alcohol dehydrogenase family)
MVDAGGAIVLVAPDEWGEGLVPEPRSGALQTLVRSLAIALGSASITVNLVSVRSPASRSSDDGPAPVAGPVCYLLARDTSYLTGQVLHVDAAS